jgi:hypothetical protein
MCVFLWCTGYRLPVQAHGCEAEPDAPASNFKKPWNFVHVYCVQRMPPPNPPLPGHAPPSYHTHTLSTLCVCAYVIYVQGIDYLCKRIGVKQSQMDLEGHRILATAACSLVGDGSAWGRGR